jgi:hypothetical protein
MMGLYPADCGTEQYQCEVEKSYGFYAAEQEVYCTVLEVGKSHKPNPSCGIGYVISVTHSELNHLTFTPEVENYCSYLCTHGVVKT